MTKKNRKKIEKYSFSLKLTEGEVFDKAKEMTKLMQQRDQLQDELKAVKDDFKAKIERKNAEIYSLSNQVSTETEWVTKECQVELLPKPGIKKYFFDGECVGQETMTKDDFNLQ